MSPRYDHRRPAVAFAVLFLVALLVMGNQMLARAVGGTTYLAFDQAPRVLLAVRPVAHDVRPPAPALAVPRLMSVVASAPAAGDVAPPADTAAAGSAAAAAPHAGRTTGRTAVRPARVAPQAHPAAVHRSLVPAGHRVLRERRHEAARSVRAAGQPAVAHPSFAPAPRRVSPPGLVRSFRPHPAARQLATPHRSHRPAGHAFGHAFGRARGHHGHGAGSRHRR